MPRFGHETEKAFPGAVDLHPHSQGALLSLVFNRGGSMKGDSRKEMRAIRDAIKNGEPGKVPQLIRDMKRLWVGKGLDGLLRRRDEEADLFDVGMTLQRIDGKNSTQTIKP